MFLTQLSIIFSIAVIISVISLIFINLIVNSVKKDWNNKSGARSTQSDLIQQKEK